MVKALFRLVVRLAVAGAVLWIARLAFKRWVEGPPIPAPSGPWPTVPAAPKPAPPVDSSWVAPDADGSAPGSHPIKAKMSSHIYHLPGMAFYDRTTPDRCYATAEDAEADGFSVSKR